LKELRGEKTGKGKRRPRGGQQDWCVKRTLGDKRGGTWGRGERRRKTRPPSGNG